ncbi:Uncharacterised protein [Streptococcus constellatus]|uniref:Uncharacterized protein n=1 Tax=Streptococcus constellatus TaxID=76860 RepID=A0A564TRU9_STRCV|nr:hypothetical protein [Streptococcus constellatus]VUX00182.1 Uncharacterised protein [Streptococcus gordonii]VUX09964.1 Uncharacterised protein [Streptococcus constellatus]
MSEKKQLLFFVAFGFALSGLEMATGLLSQLLPREFYMVAWALLVLVYVIWPALLDVIKEFYHEFD